RVTAPDGRKRPAGETARAFFVRRCIQTFSGDSHFPALTKSAAAPSIPLDADSRYCIFISFAQGFVFSRFAGPFLFVD
ncbi:MAG: hypothetical protein RIF32_18660, partial [Leptospirales bacterium]